VAFSASHDLAESLDFEGQMMALTGQTEDHVGAVRAFVAKQQPQFRGL
jgi:2-(1,2-epoxy-1,2-dihydrophenyl)acetyl-CoA isomerase